MNAIKPLPQYDYYKALEITPFASSEEIKKAYKKLALKYHPDKHKPRTDNDTNKVSINENNNQFILINEAYSVLADKKSRDRYDYIRDTGKVPEQEEEHKTQLHELFREIMAKKERMIELSESFTRFAISMGWKKSSSCENELFSAFEKEISSIESNIFNEEVNLDEQISDTNLDEQISGTNLDEQTSDTNLDEQISDTSLPDFEFSTKFLPEDDIVQVMENPQWILIDKETLILTEFTESNELLINSVTNIVCPLMMACSYGTWREQNIDILDRVTALLTKIIQYLEFIIKKAKTEGKELEPIVEMKTEIIQTHVENLVKHPILSKISNGRFGRNSYPLISLAAWVGPTIAGQSLYWSILAMFLLSIMSIRHNNGDLESFKQFLDLVEEIVSLLDHIIR